MIDVLKPLAAAFALIVLEAVVATINDIREDREQYGERQTPEAPRRSDRKDSGACVDIRQDEP